MASRVFQSMVVQMKEATQRAIGVVDSEGNVVASTDLAIMGTHIADGQVLEGMAGEKFAVIAGKTFRPLSGSDTHFDNAVFVEGTDELAQSYAVMAAIAVQSAKNYYEEKYDRSALVKNIITENILPGDIYVHAKELHFVPETARGVFYIRELSRSDIAAVDALRRVFPDRERDFVISINESDICVIKELNANACEEKDLTKVAREIEKAIGDDLKIKCVIGIGSVALHLRDLAARYKEAQIAIEVGKVFDTEKSIISYESLGIGRLIYQLPTTMCEMFLQEVFKKNPIDSLDEETLSIITEFFDNNLNISETSRKLFVHRNTLVYRLGKIKKMTGLDLREFDQAIVFKVALMVKKYLNSQKA